MHRHITYYTQSIVCQGGFSNKFLSSNSWTYAGFAKGGQILFFFFLGGGGLATRGVAKCLLGGFGGMFPRNFFFEWCNPVRFGAYFHKFFTFKKSKNIFFFSNFGGLFATFYFMVEAFFGLAPPLRKFLRAPMIARRVREHAPGNFFV